MKEINTTGIQSFMTAFKLNIQSIWKGCISNFKTVDEILSKQKADTRIYVYLSSPSLVLHLGELDDKPKEYFERTKREVSHKNVWQSRYINIRCKMWIRVTMKDKNRSGIPKI